MSKPGEVLESGPMLTAKPERPPVAGFWIRCIACILDVILLGFFQYAMVFVFKEQLLAIGKMAPYFGLAIIFFYSCLANGPVGKGKTIGKSLFNITTLRYDGKPLEMKEALIRTVVQMEFWLVVYLIIPFFSRDVRTQSLLMISHVIVYVALAFLIANAVLIGVQPFKQGFHDLLARSYVAKDPNRLTEETLVRTPDERMAKWRRSAFQSAAIAFVVILVISLYNAYRDVYREGTRKGMQLAQEARDLFAVEGFELARLGAMELPSEEGPSKSRQIERQRPRVGDSATSPSAPGAKPKHYAFVFLYVRYGSVDAEVLKHDRHIAALLEDAKRWVTEKMDMELKDMYEKGVVPEKVTFIFEESLNLVIYVYEKKVYEASLPLELAPKKSPSAGTQSKAAQRLSSSEPLATNQ
jgi:uncharacterized RDD family membrane protein YckC